MNLIGMDRKWEFDELPSSLVPAKSVPMSQYNPEEALELADKPQRLLEVPKGKYPPGVERRMKNLAQFGGRSREGTARSVANLRRYVRHMSNKELKALPEGMPVPTKIETEIPIVPPASTIRGRALRVILSKEEYNLYLEEWERWMTAHGPEYDQVEDELDVHHICMESVMQYRISLLQHKHPTRDYTNAYNQSFLRQQKARENLDASRRARLDRKHSRGLSGSGIQINVAIAAGNAARSLEQKKSLATKHEVECDDFLEATVVETKMIEAQKAKEEE
jgi:hypothetical protein